MGRTFDETDQKILTAAKSLFLEHGLHKTELKEIARCAGFSRETVYRRFLNKDEIAFYISAQVLTQLNQLPSREVLEQKKNGYLRYEACMQAMCRRYIEHPAHVRFLDEFDQSHTAPYPIHEAAKTFLEQNRKGDESHHRKLQYLEEGIRDGSVRSIKSPNFIVRCVDNSLIAICERILPRRQHYLQEHGYAEEFIWEELEMLLAYLKNDK